MLAESGFDQVLARRAEEAAHPRSRDKRIVLAKALMRAFDHWQLSTDERLTLLGMSPENRAALSRFAKGEPLAATQDTMDRASHILGIWKSLELLFPHNDDFRSAWMRSKNQAFGNHTPIEVVRAYGLPGLAIVRGVLDMMRG